ncbi:MAG: ribosomal protein S18-alanine N-acetyltransferase [Candidatus Eremiobacteraeota bacterium]|nr:ribosomal protein S18-alanine N-acetyltransferase [Candidatus Eremiobacteraeota bacterium]
MQKRINITIRKMTINDIPEVRKIESLCFDEKWHDRAFEDDLTQKNSCYIIAQYKNKLSGYMGAWFVGDEAHVTTIAVSPEFRGCGIGKLLAWKLLNTAIDYGCRWATLEVSVKNEPAGNLYRSFGFSGICNRKDYYQNGEEAEIMLARNIQFRSFKNRLEKIKREWEQKICLSLE